MAMPLTLERIFTPFGAVDSGTRFLTLPPVLAVTPPVLVPAPPGLTLPLAERHVRLETTNLRLEAENVLLRMRCSEVMRVAMEASSALAACAAADAQSQDTTTVGSGSDVEVVDDEDERLHDQESMTLPWELPPPSQPGTSVMLRNIPNNYTKAVLVDLIDVRGFAGQYDFLYLPVDFKSRANLGYAFLNFVDNEYVEGFWRAFDGFSAWSTTSRSKSRQSHKVGRLDWNKIQGLDALIERFRNNPVMHELVPEEHKPLLIIDGVEAPFPEPTQPLKAPRARKPARKGLKKQA